MTSPLRLNAPFPEFSFPAAVPKGPEVALETLSNGSFLGKPLVLFVYPRDNTPGCTLEAAGFNACHEAFKAAGVSLAGLSRDGVKSHAKFIASQGLTFPLLADEGGAKLLEWELLYSASMYGKPVTKVARNSYYIDESGYLRQIWEKVAPPGHAATVLAWVQACKGAAEPPACP